jgi:hypothetical protein
MCRVSASELSIDIFKIQGKNVCKFDKNGTFALRQFNGMLQHG